MRNLVTLRLLCVNFQTTVDYETVTNEMTELAITMEQNDHQVWYNTVQYTVIQCKTEILKRHLSPVHTADAIQLSSCVVSASALRHVIPRNADTEVVGGRKHARIMKFEHVL